MKVDDRAPTSQPLDINRASMLTLQVEFTFSPCSFEENIHLNMYTFSEYRVMMRDNDN